MPTIIFKVDCGKASSPIKHSIQTLENKVQEALSEIDYDYLVFDTQWTDEALLDAPEELKSA